ncbi:MAG: DUF1109 domain-containing protein [Burkholderiales bacterium]
MKTGALIDALAHAAGPAPRPRAARQLLLVALGGALVATTLAVSMFGWVPVAMFGGPALWTKLVYATLLAAAALWLTERLARPAARASQPRYALLAVFAAMASAALWLIAQVPPEERAAFVLGSSWAVCPWCVLLLSTPTLAGVLWVVRGMAPVHPMRAGLAAGVLAGAIGALGYSFACPEASIGFVAVWYTLGIVLTGLVGCLLGPWVWRW